MRAIPFIAASVAASVFFAGAFTSPLQAQTSISAPTGWKTQTKANGATVFTPPGLKAGEVYSVTIYDSAPGEGKTLEEYLRAFAGPVGTKPGQLAAPLQVKGDARVVTGSGTYAGPNGKSLLVLFAGVSLDGGKNIHMTRTLFSGQNDLSPRYENTTRALIQAMLERAKGEAGSNIVRVPAEVTQKMKPGGDLVPGVYAGNQYSDAELRYRFRIYLYPSGEFRFTDQNDKDIGEYSGTGKYDYNRNSGQLDLNSHFDLINSTIDADTDFCFYGRNSEGKPVIYSEHDSGFHTLRTALLWVAPPTKRLSPSAEEAQTAAIEAEKKRYKWVTPVGKGVQNAQIAAILCESKPAREGDEVYLLLRDGRVYAGLPVAPDQLDIIASRQKEPDKWGRWRKTPKGYEVSWAGAPFQNLTGELVLPAPAQQKLKGRWATGWAEPGVIYSAYALWGVTFEPSGRFRKDRRGGASTSMIGPSGGTSMTASNYDENGSTVSATGDNYAVGSTKKRNPNGDNEGEYSLNGYVLTLRYDNGKVARLPFFFFDKSHSTLWFEGATMSRDDPK